MTTLKYKPDKTVTKKNYAYIHKFFNVVTQHTWDTESFSVCRNSKNIKVPSLYVSATLGGNKSLDSRYIQQVSGSYICQVSGSYIQQVSGVYKPQKKTIETNCMGRGHCKDVATL